MRALKGLEGLISVSMVNAFMGEKGWTFLPGEGVVPDSVYGAQYLYQVYLAGDPTYTGRVTIPILWDKFEKRIVNNESSEIIRILKRSEERREGKECVSTFRSRRTPYPQKQKQNQNHTKNNTST